MSPTTVAIVNGDDDLSTWSDDEIVRGQRRLANGNWPATRPKVLPTALHDERIKRSMTRAYRLMREAAPEAIAVLREILNDPDATRADRSKASQIILSHVMPKAVHVDMDVTVGATPAFVKVVQAAMVYQPADEAAGALGPGGGTYDDVIDAEIVEDDPEIEWEEDEVPQDRTAVSHESPVQAGPSSPPHLGDLNARTKHPRAWKSGDFEG